MPIIEQCKDSGTTQGICKLRTTKQSPTFTLDCTVTGFKPNVTLTWKSSTGILNPLWPPIQKKLTDGTWERTVTISVVAKDETSQNFTCEAEGEAISNGKAVSAVTVLPLSDAGLNIVYY